MHKSRLAHRLSYPHIPSTMNNLSIRLLVTSKEAGILIGKDGSQVTLLREESNSRISISKMVPKVNERIVQITGTVESIRLVLIIDKALRLVVETLGQDEPKTNCSLLVPHQLAGAIIGKQGSRIKSIQQETGAKITISKDLLPQSTERVVEFHGQESELIPALKMVLDAMVEDWESAVGLIPYDPSKRPRSTAPRRNFERSNDRYQDRTKEREERKPKEEDGVSTTTKLAVPVEMVGSIIGPGGKLINEIRVESGAKIHISPKEPNRKDRDVLITGNLDSIAKALKMLHFYLEQEKERKALE